MLNTVKVTNGEPSALPKGAPVRVNDDGEAVLAGVGDVLTSRVVGLVRNQIAAGGVGRIITDGVLNATATQWDVITGASGGLLANRAYYLSSTGRITDLEGGTRIGVALSAYAMSIQIGATVEGAEAQSDARVAALEARVSALVAWMIEYGFELPAALLLDTMEE